MDLFVSKGWKGLLTVILIIFKESQETILNSSYEEILLFFTELHKNNF